VPFLALSFAFLSSTVFVSTAFPYFQLIPVVTLPSFGVLALFEARLSQKFGSQLEVGSLTIREALSVLSTCR
jgi:hypothetical protein